MVLGIGSADRMRWVRSAFVAIVLGLGAGAIAALWQALEESKGVLLATPPGDATSGEGTPRAIDRGGVRPRGWSAR
jgi:hypothetical protein